ncbi:hypothetical protein Tco_0937315 [Tanacetum coccineum]|uniref:Uncharacterized protein n=1 Tax=Tanacetum coccineum TaxID=301880 RepID=A0ABQ5DEP3_9ASTR
MFFKKNVDYDVLIWEDFQYQIDTRQTSAKRREQMPYPRFTKIIINHFLSKQNTLPKRHGSFIHSIKYDSVMAKLKFVNKGEKDHKYGMLIPNLMMNDEIRESVPYMTYLALSTNTEENIPKMGKGKGLMGKNKADASVPMKELAESISRTEAEHQEEERRLNKTHAISSLKEN